MSPLWLLAFSAPSVALISFTALRIPPLFALTQVSTFLLCHKVLAFDNMVSITIEFSQSVKLWHPVIDTDYERAFLGFSLLEASSCYVQPETFFFFLQAWQLRMEQLMVYDCST